MNTSTSHSITLKVTLDNDLRRVTLANPTFEAAQRIVASMFGEDAFEQYRVVYVDDEGDKVSIKTDLDWQEALAQTVPNADTGRRMLRLTLEDPSTRNRRHGKKGHKGRRQPRGGCPRHRARAAAAGAPDAVRNLMHMASRALQSQQGLAGVATCIAPYLRMAQGLGCHVGQQGAQVGAQASNQMRLLLSKLLESQPEVAAAVERLLGSDHVCVEHDALCDACDKAIRGTRHKCEACDDYDLCDACYGYASKEHADGAHTFRAISAAQALRDYVSGASGQVLDAFLAQGSAKAQPVRHAAVCDGCDDTIFGVRHKCQQCPDFDVCTKCLESDNVPTQEGGHQSHHTFCHMTHPGQPFHAAEAEAEAEVEVEVEEEPLLQEAAASGKAEAEAQVDEEEDEIVVITEEEEEEEAEEPVEATQVCEPEPEEEKPKLTLFEENLKALEDMGFQDRPKNIKVLVSHRGQLFPALQELLRQ